MPYVQVDGDVVHSWEWEVTPGRYTRTHDGELALARPFTAAEEAWADAAPRASASRERVLADLRAAITADQTAAVAAASAADVWATRQRDRAAAVRAVTAPTVAQLRDEVAAVRDDLAAVGDMLAGVQRWRATVDRLLLAAANTVPTQGSPNG